LVPDLTGEVKSINVAQIVFLRDIRVRDSLRGFVLLSNCLNVVKYRSEITFTELSFFYLFFWMVFEAFTYIVFGRNPGLFLSFELNELNIWITLRLFILWMAFR